jgi:hypothetical protein
MVCMTATSSLKSAAFTLLATAGGWSLRRLQTTQEIFAFVDTDRNNNLNSIERDRLWALFPQRTDLWILDRNGNRRLDREELHALEKSRKIKRDRRKKR